MLRSMNGFGAQSFANFPTRYPLSGFFGTGPNTLTGSIDPGPFASTFGLHLKVADPIWQQTEAFDNQQGWIYSEWIKPHALAATKSLVLFQDRTFPNLGTQFVVQITPAGKIIVSTGFGLNVFVFPATFDQPDPAFVNGLFATSNAALPMDVYSHVCVKVWIAQNTDSPAGSCQIYINGGLDTSIGGKTTAPSGRSYANWVVPTWHSVDGSEITRSQPVVCDWNGSRNNTAVPISAQVATLLVTSDVDNGNWLPLAAGPNFAMVDNVIGPSSSAYVSIASLIGGPDQLFGINPLATAQNNLGLALNIGAQLAGAATLQALTKVGATRYLLGSPLTVPNPSPAVQQAISETNPATGNAWKDSEISAAAWGMRGLTGTGELVEQVYIEKLWSSPSGDYSY